MHRRSSQSALLLLAASFAAATLASGQSPSEPLALRSVANARTLAFAGRAAAISPDGQLIAATVIRPPEERIARAAEYFFTLSGVERSSVGASIWIVDARSGDRTVIGTPTATTWAPAWSPDGKMLAFYSDRDGSARLWIWNRTTRQTRRASDVIVRPYTPMQRPLWMSDNRRVISRVIEEGLTIARANALINTGTMTVGSAQPAAKATQSAGAAVRVFTSGAPGAPAPSTTASRPAGNSGARTDSLGGASRADADLAVVDVVTGRAVRVARRVRPVTYLASPNGHTVVFTHYYGTNLLTQQAYANLRAVEADGTRPRLLAGPIETLTSVSWSPDGKQLAYSEGGTNPDVGTVGNAFIVDIASGATTNVTRGAHPNFGDYLRAPIWTPSGDAILLLGAGTLWKANVRDTLARNLTTVARWVIKDIVSNDENVSWSAGATGASVVTAVDTSTMRSAFLSADLTSGAVRILREDDRSYGSINRAMAAANGDALAFTAEAAHEEPNVWVSGREVSRARRLTQINAEIDRLVLGKSRLVSWPGLDGKTLRGALLLPPDYQEGRRYPLIVYLYPGRESGERVNRFGIEPTALLNLQMLATRGYAVLHPETPTRMGTPMRDIHQGVMSAVRHVAALGIADSTRLGVFGHSYGGYATAAVLVQEPLFKAGVMADGPVDLVSWYGELSGNGFPVTVGWAETGQGRLGASPWEHRDRYIENSPLFFMDRVKAPLLIVHGASDQAVPVSQSDEAFVALRRLGKTVEYRRYEGEGHGVVSIANLEDYWAAVVRWFDRYVKGAS